MTTQGPQIPEHPPKPNWNAREMAIVLSLGLILLSVAIDFMVDNKFDWRAFLADLPPNIVGALIVFWLFEFAYSRRQQEELKAKETEEEIAQTKSNLIIRMGSQVNDTAVSAANELRDRGWLTNGTLRRAFLSGANLQDAELSSAYLKEVILYEAKLQNAKLPNAYLQSAILDRANLDKADLWFANLEGADLVSASMQETILESANLLGADLRWAKLMTAYLSGANLNRADLGWADLQETDLSTADMRGANLTWANLRGANLYRANLEGVDFHEKEELQETESQGIDLSQFFEIERLETELAATKFDEKTELPDGTFWTPDTDMTRFTNPNHPSFWRPEPGSVRWYRTNPD